MMTRRKLKLRSFIPQILAIAFLNYAGLQALLSFSLSLIRKVMMFGSAQAMSFLIVALTLLLNKMEGKGVEINDDLD